MKTTRREFLEQSAAAATVGGLCLCGLGGLGALGGCVLKGDTPGLDSGAYFLDGDWLIIHLDLVPDLDEVGGAAKIIDDRLPSSLVIARTAGDTFVAVTLDCAHGGNEVEYKHDEAVFRCVSMGKSTYDLDGSYLSGPAKSGLESFPVTVDGTVLEIDLR